jgi:hypothetical protein
MPTFIASMSYDVSDDTPAAARKLLRAELVGRRWHDRVRDRLMPQSAVWMERVASEGETTSLVHDQCAEDLRRAAAAVEQRGLTCRVTRAFIQVSGGGSYGLAGPDAFKDSPPQD